MRKLVEPPPAERAALYLERAELALIGHLRRILHPVAEIDIVEPGHLHLADMVEDEQVPETPPRVVGVEEAVNHREPVGHDVGESEGEQRPLGDIALPVLNQHRLHRRVLDHVLVVDKAHLRHAAAGMPRLEVALEEPVLLGGGAGRADLDGNVVVELEYAPIARRQVEFARHDPDALARRAAVAGGPIDEVLAAPETVVAEQVMERSGAPAGQMREKLTLLP